MFIIAIALFAFLAGVGSGFLLAFTFVDNRAEEIYRRRMASDTRAIIAAVADLSDSLKPGIRRVK